jgi:hypothetical protein
MLFVFLLVQFARHILYNLPVHLLIPPSNKPPLPKKLPTKGGLPWKREYYTPQGVNE